MTRKQLSNKTPKRQTWKTIIALALFLAIAFLALTLPDHPDAIQLRFFLRLPLEIPLVALALMLLPRRLAMGLAAVVSLIAFALLFLKIADIGVQSAFQRRFNPYLDINMLGDGWNLLSGAIGQASAGIAIAAVMFGFLWLFSVFSWSQRQMVMAGQTAKRAMLAGICLLLVTGGALWQFGPVLGLQGIVQARTASYLGDRLSLVARSISDMRAFENDLAGSEGSETGEGLFEAIAGRDLVLIFIESYGRSAVEDPRYRPLIGPRLTAVEEQLDAAGFASASGWSRSPTVGGLSWLAHGTFLSGLWIDNQARYDRLMISKRKSLNRLFVEAGWQAAAIMPAISMDWPEAAYYGYDRIFAARDLEYRGKPFNWVTMPDQYTLSAFEKLARQPARKAGKPVMAEIALISSHAPWTPVPTLIDWSAVGDGSVFNDQAQSGDSPSVVWADAERVRRQYILTIDYSLETIGDYIVRFGEDAVFVILGDHQPAAIVTGPDASRAVPVHVVSRDNVLIERFAAEGFVGGMKPVADAPELAMDSMRDRLIRIFGKE